MDAKELRIGNLVLVDGKITKIESIDDQGINSSVSGGYYPGETEIEYESRFGGKSFWGGYPEPMPVPLTPEILIACGFEKGALTLDLNDIWYLGKYGGGFYLQVERHIKYESSILECINLPHIQNLHRLQNLYFSLTGEELTYTPLSQTIPSNSTTVTNTEEK